MKEQMWLGGECRRRRRSRRTSRRWGGRREGLGDGWCSPVTLSSAFTLMLSFCPVLISSLIFFSFITSSFSSILSFCLSPVAFFLCSALLHPLLPPFAFMLVLLLFPSHLLSSPPIPYQKQIQTNFNFRKPCLPPTCCCFEQTTI